MKLPKIGGNWGLKLLALVLAIVLYYTLKTESSANRRFSYNDRNLFQSH